MLPLFITPEEFTLLQNPDIVEYKYRLIYKLLYYTKIRVKDLLHLRFDQVEESEDEDGGILRQGKKATNVDERLFKELLDFIEFDKRRREVKPNQKESDFVFVGQRGPHTVITLNRTISEHCRLVGIRRHLSSTSFQQSAIGKKIALVNYRAKNLQLRKSLLFIFFSDPREEQDSLRVALLHENFEMLQKFDKTVEDKKSVEYYALDNLSLTMIRFESLVSYPDIEEGVIGKSGVFYFVESDTQVLGPAHEKNLEQILHTTSDDTVVSIVFLNNKAKPLKLKETNFASISAMNLGKTISLIDLYNKELGGTFSESVVDFLDKMESKYE